MEAPRERVFELILAAKSVRECGCSRLVVCQCCTGLAYVLYRFPELRKKGTPQAWLPADVYETRPILGRITDLGWEQSVGVAVERQWSAGGRGVAGATVRREWRGVRSERTAGVRGEGSGAAFQERSAIRCDWPRGPRWIQWPGGGAVKGVWHNMAQFGTFSGGSPV